MATAPDFVAHLDKKDESYLPSYAYSGDYLNAAHRDALASVEAVPGWLRPEEAEKLYELAYFASGPVVEIGTYHGKSTVILASALRDAGRNVEFLSLDIDAQALDYADKLLAERGLGRYVHLVRATSAVLFRVRPELEPGFVFVDGDHTLKGVQRDLAAIRDHVPVGGVIFFHDFTDRRYGVHTGVTESWVMADCEFAGRFGCAVLFRRVRRDPVATADGPRRTDLIGLESRRLRFRSQLLAPATAGLRYRQIRDRLRPGLE